MPGIEKHGCFTDNHGSSTLPHPLSSLPALSPTFFFFAASHSPKYMANASAATSRPIVRNLAIFFSMFWRPTHPLKVIG